MTVSILMPRNGTAKCVICPYLIEDGDSRYVLAANDEPKRVVYAHEACVEYLRLLKCLGAS